MDDRPANAGLSPSVIKRLAILVLAGTFGLGALAQSLPPSASGIRLQRNTNLVVHWKASGQPWPKALWLYKVAPTRFSPMVISNLMAIGHFTAKDKKDYGTNGMVFSPRDGSRNLRISFPEGSIEYWSTRSYGPTNLARDVPSGQQLSNLTVAILPKLGLSLAEISKAVENAGPKLTFFESPMQYFADGKAITNIEWSGVRFNRALDGVELEGEGGNCEIDFGDHGRVKAISLSWRNVERDTLFPTVSPTTIIRWLCEGRAIYQPATDKLGNEVLIDWLKVKNLIVEKAQPYYWGEVYPVGRAPAFPSWTRPFAALLATAQVDTNDVKLAIQCPIIDETKRKK